ncbi:MAG: hypothetical protein LUO98_02910, partial [Methanoregula sp.]|nr:hypothetical protein [Methanoregula sp.]
MVIQIVYAAPPTSENPFEPCLQDSDPPAMAPVKEIGAFQTSLYTGSGSYVYPIELPPGTNKLAPKLELAYSSHNARDRSSLVGSGWSLTESYVRRDANSTPYDLTDDTFDLVLEGQQYRLVFNGTENRYHTEEESYLFIERTAGSPENAKGEYWNVRKTGGTRYRFGYTADAESLGVTTGNVTRWNLDTVEDPHGNHIYYTYVENPTTNDIGTSYLSRI